MAKVVLLSLYDRFAIGLGYLSAYLKEHGHEPYCVYFKEYEVIKRTQLKDYEKGDHHVMVLNSGNEIVLSYARPPEQTEIEFLKTLVQNISPDLIGISFRSIAKKAVFAITEALHPVLGIPIVWGGIAPTIEPEECIKVNDMICIGEGEHPLLELANAIDRKEDTSGIENIWTRHNGEIVRNPVRPLLQDLDELPFPDYLAERKFFVDGRGIQEGVSIKNFNGVYEIMTSRGCPFSCSFCCNSQLRDLFKKGRYVRRRTVANVIEELVAAKEHFPVRYINFQDDVFTFNGEWLREFADEYKRHVRIPFWCYHHPNYANKETLAILKDCGVERVTMGVQSGSDYILKEVYNRYTSKEKVLTSARLLKELQIDYNIDVITNNPLEREEDCEATLNLLLKIEKPVIFNGGLSQLTVYPGTKIAEQLCTPGWQNPVNERVFFFYNLLYLLCQTRLPRNWISRFQRSGFIKRNPSVLKVFLIVPWLKVDLILGMKNMMPRRMVRILKEIKNLPARLRSLPVLIPSGQRHLQRGNLAAT